MSLTIITPDPARWDSFVNTHPRAHLLQLCAWGELKAAFGWTPQRVAVTNPAGELVAGAQILFRRLPLRLGQLAYIPYGPLVDWTDTAQVHAVLNAIDQVARQYGAVFLKIEPGFHLPDVDFAAFGFKASAQTVQPPRTVTLDIRGDDDTIQARMNQKTRRNIRKSIKYDITIRTGSAADVASFNALLDETGDRAAFGVHVPAYYERAYNLFVPAGRAALLLGSYAGQDLAGVMVFALGEWAWYLYGASSGQERQRMASYGVQWAGIQWAKAQGAAIYDMYGVPDVEPDELEAQFQDRSDGMWGVYRFKRGWGGEVMRSVGAWDRVYNPALYAVYRIGSKFR
ncbi:MAG: peptidoglycan bridge formation glycyltransferase FemA/FemB family protein [Anaerolineae bacterium]|nr:peptidoglycan bridge formation glycyltransferase FemA/FemB family protein [Anaerolineae bacterium]